MEGGLLVFLCIVVGGTRHPRRRAKKVMDVVTHVKVGRL